MKAVVSGATRGIGNAIAIQLAKEGYDLVLLARNEGQLKQLKEKLIGYKISVDFLAVDLSSDTTIEILEQNSELFKDTSI
ncbi:MAG: SDR family NAD(P)-dependent oxidoreductase, partial [Flavobacteriales bacterium]|nr:SDR family NAD(P)-dependent oxidoreductase [Flavobacteriales bacterium]